MEDTMIAESYFIDFVNANTKAGAAGKTYMRAIRDLEKLISDEVFNAYSLDQLETLKKRLSNNGDLHNFNVQTNNRALGAAIGKLIELYCRENKQTDVKTVAHLQPYEIKQYVNSLKKIGCSLVQFLLS